MGHFGDHGLAILQSAAREGAALCAVKLPEPVEILPAAWILLGLRLHTPLLVIGLGMARPGQASKYLRLGLTR